MAKVFVPKERAEGETRVAASPETVKRLVKEGFEVVVETGAGRRASFVDSQYEAAGAKVVSGDAVKAGWAEADVVVKVAPVGPNESVGGHEADAMREGAVLISFANPHQELAGVAKLRDRKVSALAMELVPRISRAQSMDALSSQASIGGYKAVLLAAAKLDKYCPLLMTAAGTIQPARFVIMGAGVAGLQAIATARRLGAIVEVSDVRPAVKEQVESLGGKFIDFPMDESGEGQGGYARELTPEQLKAQQAVVRKRVLEADVVITTALIPGRPAPKLITADMVEEMREGAVIVDMAITAGGNCELSEPGETVKHGVTIIAHPNLPGTLPLDASLMYARNVQTLLLLFGKGGEIKLDLEDEIIDGALLTHDGKVRHAPTQQALTGAQS
ncbi:MAG: Re/Si-specific NAD(P)(+) transhydrogenase subunit alpha [Myxococcales bacterium]|nr:Re/Si-specific NAD(P)(+) transhydrogenase subunit alpha [Myxococcales bacterium]MCB9629311.1 Re/Si-specific NAD(P)(+) transhydrogenase subunit alpha [Sandaracinaceae bacterium]